jgi:O-antigen ligase
MIIIGYTLFTTLFLPVTSDIETPQSITIPFRLLSLFVSILTIWLNFNKKSKINIFIRILLLFWFMYITKLFTVISLTETTAASFLSNKYQYYMYAIGTVFIPLISIIYSYQNINIKKLFWSIFFSGLIILTLSLVSNIMRGKMINTDISTIRQSGNLALGTISYGHIAITIALLSIYVILFININLYIKILCVPVLCVSLYISFLAGSRSPIVAFIFTLIILLFSRQRNFYKGTLSVIILVLFLVVFENIIYETIEELSPIMYVRLEAALAGDSSARNLLYTNAWNQFLDSPFGNDFVLVSGYGKGMYPHNLILESLISLGIMGGVIIIILLVKSISKSIILFKKKKAESFLAVIFLQYVILYMFSYSLYSANILFCLMSYILMNNNKTLTINTQNE